MYSYAPESEDEDYDDSEYSQASFQADQLVKRRIVHGEIEFSGYVWDKMPRGMASQCPKDNSLSSLSMLARNLCRDLLIYDPMDRATAKIALQHVWFTAELLDLELAYRSRIGTE